MIEIKKIVILCWVVILLSACNNKANDAAADKEVYQKASETLLAKEKKNPVAYLTVSSHDKHNLLGQTVIKGTINNIAKVCSFKDVELQLSFYSKTNALLEKDIETVYEIVLPGESTNFKTKYFAPKGTDSVVINVLSAKIKE